MKFEKNRFFRVIDNSGVRVIKCIGVSKTPLPFPFLLITGSIRELRSSAKSTFTIQKGQVFTALVVRAKNIIQRSSGLSTHSDYSGVILLNNSNRPLGTKIKGGLAKDLRCTPFLRIASLSEGLY